MIGKLGLGDTENVHCDYCNKRWCDYCGNIAIKYKRIWHHPTCMYTYTYLPLENSNFHKHLVIIVDVYAISL